MKRQRESLYKLQKRIIRGICGAQFRDHCMPLFKKEEILTLEDHLCLENSKLIYKIIHKILPKPVHLLFELPQHNHNVRNQTVHVTKHRYAKMHNSVLSKAMVDWQKLPRSLKESSSLHIFLNKVKENLLKQY